MKVTEFTHFYLMFVQFIEGVKLKHFTFSEAAFTTLLHADLLSWEPNILPSNGMFHEEPEWKRKERLYRDIIYLFDKGKVRHL